MFARWTVNRPLSFPYTSLTYTCWASCTREIPSLVNLFVANKTNHCIIYNAKISLNYTFDTLDM